LLQHQRLCSPADRQDHRATQAGRDLRRSVVQPPLKAGSATRSDQVAQGFIQLGLENLCSPHCFGNVGMPAPGCCARFSRGTAKIIASVCGYRKRDSK